MIGDEEGLFQEGVRLSAPAQHLRAATFEGLVAMDAQGEIIPAIAERWIVADDGLSYIFRLRDSNWPDEEPVHAAELRLLLQERLGRLQGTSLGLDLEKITEIRAMTDRVIELRLSGPMPDFLRLLAQPELGFAKRDSAGGPDFGAGPMLLTREEGAPAQLDALPPQARGLPARRGWEDSVRPLRIRALPVESAVSAFSNGDVDLVLNGTITDFPSAQLGPLSRGNVQVDPAIGLLGFAIKSDEGVLSDASRRQALSMAIDRSRLSAAFGLSGWLETEWIVPPASFGSQNVTSRWPGLSIEQRRQIARQRIASWEIENGEEAILRIGLPQGEGSDLLFREIASAWQAIDVSIERVGLGEGAELELYDRLARYSSPRWFLNQFNCGLNNSLCSPEADEIVEETLAFADVESKQVALLEAHTLLTEQEVFIPLGAPIRWSLVRGSLDGYAPNRWGQHPLFLVASPTT